MLKPSATRLSGVGGKQPKKGRGVKKAAFIWLVLLFSHSASAEEKPGSLLFGDGLDSCASCLQPAHFHDGKAWIFGFWSGLNAGGGLVGSNTDGAAILAEVRRICEQEPSTRLVEAVAKHYRSTMMREKNVGRPAAVR